MGGYVKDLLLLVYDLVKLSTRTRLWAPAEKGRVCPTAKITPPPDTKRLLNLIGFIVANKVKTISPNTIVRGRVRSWIVTSS